MATKLGNVNLLVSDVERSRRFYTELLGLHEPEERDGPPTMLLLEAGGCTISLQDPVAMRRSPEPAGGIEIGFEVEDVDAVWNKLKETGADIDAVQEQGWGRTFDARDPDGYSIVIYRMAEACDAWEDGENNWTE